MKIPKIKNCPFCNGEAVLRSKTVINSPDRDICDPWVQCLDCGCQTVAYWTGIKVGSETWKEVYYNGVKTVIEYWNNRVAENKVK